MPPIDDTRGVSEVIGVIIIFSFLVIAFTGYQATVVPNQNSQVEAAHYSDVQGDLAALRGGLITAGQAGSTQTVTVSVGTTYPSRLVALNAPPPVGQLRTQSVGPGEYISSSLDLGNICGYETSSMSTSAIVYQPNYNYFEGGDYNHRLESTLLYQVTGGQPLVRQTQSLVDPNSKTVSLYPIQGSPDTQAGIEKSVDLVGGLSGEATSADFDLTVPTQAGVETWDEAVSDSVTVADADGYENAVELEFDGSWTVECYPVGLGDAPSQPVIPEGANENGDTEPPLFASGPSATPNPVLQGDTFELDATIIARGGSDIISATWSDDQGNGGDLAAVDGSFDQPTEAVSSTIDTGGWSLGDHTITVVGTDATGQTVSQSTTVTVTDSDPSSDTPTPNEPRFDTLDVSAGGNINRVMTSGTLTQADSNGQIQVTLYLDSDGNSPRFGRNSNQMTSDFGFTTSPNTNKQKQIYVEIRLLDGNDDPYQTCFSDDPVEKNSPLSLSDFSCQSP